MNNSKLKVIRGGLSDSYNTSRKTFLSAYITDTRLMGVVGMYIHWSLPDNKALKDFHQFFYFDAEEYGFDTYKSLLGNDEDDFCDIENSLIGGLGGKKIPLTLAEAKYVLCQYANINMEEGLEFPKGEDEYGFLLDVPPNLTEPEIYTLMSKQCVTINSDYELINYFLMRIFGKDFGAASFLSTQDFDLDIFPDFNPGTFCKNNIRETSESNVYACHSLIEFDDTYYVVVTNITVNGQYVSDLKRVSSMEITAKEAALQLKRSEFISVYDVIDDSYVDKNMSKLTKKAMLNRHVGGDLYMLFNPDNNHVAKKHYRLDEDVLGLYFVSYNNQLIAVAYSYEAIKILENDLSASKVKDTFIPLAKYEFIEPVLFEFIQSDFVDFELFVEAIKK